MAKEIGVDFFMRISDQGFTRGKTSLRRTISVVKNIVDAFSVRRRDTKKRKEGEI